MGGESLAVPFEMSLLMPFHKENNHGLDHKCGTCATVLSNPRAKKTCIGRHEEVCTRYHKTLFFIGASHKCDACYKTVEQHLKRHREILSLVRDIQEQDHSMPENDTPERKKETSKNKSDELSLDQEAEDDKVLSTVSSTFNSLAGSKRLRLQKFQQADAGVDTRLIDRNNNKVGRLEQLFQVITAGDLDHVQSVLHPEDLVASSRRPSDYQALVDSKTVRANVAFNVHCMTWKMMHTSCHQKRLEKAEREDAVRQDRKVHIHDLLANFGVKRAPNRSSKNRKLSLNKLVAAVEADLVAHANEQVETMQRMAGFFRYVNKRTYNIMVRISEIWDWSTGEKLPEIDEDDLNDLIEDDTVSLNRNTQVEPCLENGIDVHRKHLLENLPFQTSKRLTEPCVAIRFSNPPPQERSKSISGPAFRPTKDDRVLSKAIRAASPSKKKPVTLTQYCSLPSQQGSTELREPPPQSTNTYDALDPEVAAPCDELPPPRRLRRKRHQANHPIKCLLQRL